MSEPIYVPMKHIHVSTKYSHFIPEGETGKHKLTVSCPCKALVANAEDVIVMFHHGEGWHWEDKGGNDFMQVGNE